MTTLTEYLAGWPRRFDWGDSHCAHFALGWVQAATGRPALAAIPAVVGVRDWLRTLADAGGMERMVSECLRCKSIPADQAQPGDLVMLPGLLTGGALGIRLHAGVAALAESGRIEVVSVQRAVCAWPLAGLMKDAA